MLLVFLGAGSGASTRYILMFAIGQFWDYNHYNLAIFVANFVACLLIAVVASKLPSKKFPKSNVKNQETKEMISSICIVYSWDFGINVFNF